jgi:hypothetical protein
MTLPNGGITAIAASSRLAGAVPASAAPATTRLTVSPALKSVFPLLPVTVLSVGFGVVFAFVVALVSSRGPRATTCPASSRRSRAVAVAPETPVARSVTAPQPTMTATRIAQAAREPPVSPTARLPAVAFLTRIASMACPTAAGSSTCAAAPARDAAPSSASQQPPWRAAASSSRSPSVAVLVMATGIPVGSMR